MAQTKNAKVKENPKKTYFKTLRFLIKVQLQYTKALGVDKVFKKMIVRWLWKLKISKQNIKNCVWLKRELD